MKDLGAFKTPTLRDIELTGPYMHDGSIRTLLDVLRFYNQGGVKTRMLDKEDRAAQSHRAKDELSLTTSYRSCARLAIIRIHSQPSSHQDSSSL